MIYCVEDDENIRELIVYTLSNTGFESYGFSNADEFYGKLYENLPSLILPSLILLDIMLPEKDGLEILKELKKSHKTKDIPIILITAKSSEFDKVKGLDLGADDYIAKPFGMMEMVSRVKAVLRRCGKKESIEEIHMANISLNNTQRIVKVDNNEIMLSFKEFELLKFFMENPHRVFTRDALLKTIWGYDYYGESRTVDVHIRTLRQKLGQSAQNIQTVRNVGYKMCT